MATFGQTTGGTATGGGASPNSGDRCWASKFTLPVQGDITKLTALFGFDSGNASLGGDSAKAVIYADSAGVPAAKIAASAAGVAISAGDQTVDFPLVVNGLAAGDYWLGIVSNGFQSRLAWAPGTGSIRKESLTYTTPQTPMTAPDDSAVGETFAVYATYTATAGGGGGSQPQPWQQAGAMLPRICQ